MLLRLFKPQEISRNRLKYKVGDLLYKKDGSAALVLGIIENKQEPDWSQVVLFHNGTLYSLFGRSLRNKFIKISVANKQTS